MSEKPSLPLAGYRLKQIVALRLQYELALEDDLPKKREIRIFWNWRVSIPEEREIEVIMGIDVGPTEESPDKIHVTLVAEFEVSARTTVPLPQFVLGNVPAMIVPYLRENLSTISSRGPFDTYYLPALNVRRIMEPYTFGSSEGANQLRGDPELASQYGVNMEEFPDSTPPND